MPINFRFNLKTVLTALPAIAIFCFVILVQQQARGQMGVFEPFVLVGPNAGSLAKALEPRISTGPDGVPANVVVIFPASPSTAHLVLVDTETQQKFWTVVPLATLAEIMQKIGSPA